MTIKSEPNGSFFYCASGKFYITVIDFIMRKKRRNGDNDVVVATVIVALLFVVAVGYFVGGDNIVSNVFAKETKEARAFYFLTTDTFDDIVIARQNADIIRNRGGAGYVDMSCGNRIILAVYPNEQSAKSVQQKMGDNSIVVSAIDISKIKIDMKKKDLNTASGDALEYFDIAFNELYNMSNSLADNKTTIEETKVKLRVLRTQIDDIKSVFYEKTKEADISTITEIKVALVTCLALIDGVEISDYAHTLSSLRRQTVQLVFCYSSLANTLFSA